MKKTLIAFTLLLIGAAVFYWVKAQKPQTVTQVVQAVNEYPNMILSKSDGTQLSARDLKGKNILIIYFTECDHCQREALEISKNLKAFTQYNLWFLSTDPFDGQNRFAHDYKLENYSNVHFAQIQFQDVATYFGSIPTPSVYIYSESKKLVKAINGETPIEMIIQFL